MRITTHMMTNTVLRNLQRNLRRLEHVNDQVSSAQRIRNLSDDPVGVSTILQLDSQKAQILQHVRNIEDAQNWLDATDHAMSTISEALQRAQELTIAAANDGTLAPENRQGIIAELTQILHAVFGTANYNLHGRYIFGGQKTTTRPFGGTPEAPVYQGDSGQLMRVIDVGVNVAINTPGDTALMPSLQALNQALQAVSAHDPAAMRDAIDALKDAHTTLLIAQSRVGGIANQLEASKARQESLSVSASKLRSDLMDVDMAEALIEYGTLEATTRAALSAGARAIQPTLFDYLA